MRNLFKKGLSAAIALSMAASMAVMIPITASAAYTTNEAGVSGTWEESGTENNGTWSFDTDKMTMTITGTGAMPTANNGKYPWVEFVGNIKNVVIDDGITVIPVRAFTDAKELISVSIPNSVTGIGNRAFMNCKNLSAVTLPSSLTALRDAAFARTGLTEITIPDSVTTMGAMMFLECESLTTAKLSSGVTSIPKQTFDLCSSLTSVEIPDSVTIIGQRAFADTGLTNITIPSSVTQISGGALAAPTLKTIEIAGDGTTAGGYSVDEATGCLVKTTTTTDPETGETTTAKSLVTYPATKTDGVLPEGLTEVATGAFTSVPETTEITYNGDNADLAKSIAKAVVLETTNESFKATAPAAAGDNKFNESTFKAWAEGDTVGAMGFISTLTGGSVPESFKTTDSEGADTTAVKTAVDKITWTITIGDKQYQKIFTGTTVSLDANGEATIKVLIDGFDEAQYGSGISAVTTSLD